jgi:hypothetical protein
VFGEDLACIKGGGGEVGLVRVVIIPESYPRFTIYEYGNKAGEFVHSFLILFERLSDI